MEGRFCRKIGEKAEIFRVLWTPVCPRGRARMYQSSADGFPAVNRRRFRIVWGETGDLPANGAGAAVLRQGGPDRRTV